MNRIVKKSLIVILKPLSKVDDLSRMMLPWSAVWASKNYVMILTKVVTELIGGVADMVLLALVTPSETFKYSIKKPPDWEDPYGAKKDRKKTLANRIKRKTTEAKIEWLKENRPPEDLDAYLKSIRNE